MNLRPATAADIPSIIELERSSPAAAHWTESQYRRAILPGDQQRLVLVAEGPPSATVAESSKSESGVLGFIVARHLAPEWELENLVVAPSARRKGIGEHLLEALLSAARKTDSESVFLEVRESNTAGRSLYERAGFVPDGCRRAYYPDPTEDAVLYRLKIGPSSAKNRS